MLKSFYCITSKFLLFFLILLFNQNLLAQAQPMPAPAAPSPQAPAAPTPSAQAEQVRALSPEELVAYYQVMRQWAEVTNFAKNGAEIATNKLKMELLAEPKYQKIVSPEFMAEIEQFFYELFISQQMMIELTKLYSQYFTLDEMKQLIAFYKTPLGQKLVKTNSELMIKSQIISTELLRRNQKRYMEAVGKFIRSVQEGNSKKAPQ